MIVLTEATFPGTSCVETATAWMEFIKTNPPPEYVKIIDMYVEATRDGYRTLLFTDVIVGKEAEGFKYLSKVTVQLMNTIEGYNAELRVVYNMVDGFEFLGMNAPAV